MHGRLFNKSKTESDVELQLHTMALEGAKISIFTLLRSSSIGENKSAYLAKAAACLQQMREHGTGLEDLTKLAEDAFATEKHKQMLVNLGDGYLFCCQQLKTFEQPLAIAGP